MIERLQVRIPAGAAGECFSLRLTLCADSYSVSVPPRVTAVACKRPRSFCQKCRWQVIPKHAYFLDPTTSERAYWAAIQAWCGNELTRNSSGNSRPQSSQLAAPLWIDPGLKSGIRVRELISTLKKKKKEKKKKREIKSTGEE